MFDLSGFETFEGARRKRVDPAFSIQARGALSFNSAAAEKMGNPEHVRLMFNPDAALIAIKEEDNPGPASVRVRSSGKGAGGMVSAKAFLDAYNLPYDVLRSLEIVALQRGLAVLRLPASGEGASHDGEE